MASNGDATRLERELEAALNPQSATPHMALADGPDILTRLNNVVELLDQLGGALGENGEQDRQEVHAFARDLKAHISEWAMQLSARKRSELDSLQKVIGRISTK